MNRPARFTQTDIVRAIRAAKKAGAGDVVVEPDGRIRISTSPTSTGGHDLPPVETEREVVL